MANKGFILIHKKITEWKYFTNPTALLIFQYLIMYAAHKDFYRNGQKINKGQWVGSRRRIAKDLDISKVTVNKYISLFLQSDELKEEKVKGNLIMFTVMNYKKYQHKKKEQGDRTNGSHNNKERNSALTGTNSQPQNLWNDEDYLNEHNRKKK
jgi:hypothetical protein